MIKKHWIKNDLLQKQEVFKGPNGLVSKYSKMHSVWLTDDLILKNVLLIFTVIQI